MKTHNPLLRGAAAIAIGTLVVINPQEMIYLVLQLTGIVLMLLGAMQLVFFFSDRPKTELSWQNLPLGGVLGVVFGGLLIIIPDTFVSFFMKLVGVALIGLAVLQVVELRRVRTTLPEFPAAGYIFPVAMGLSGLVFFFFSLDSAAWLLIFAGAWVLAYGISEVTAWFLIRHYRLKKESSDPQPGPQ